MKQQLVAFAFVSALAVACGGADLGLLAPNDGSIASLDAQPSDDASPNDDANELDAAPPSDASTLDVTPIKDAAYQDPGIACGKTECDPKANLCCGTVTSYYPQMTYSYACEPLSDLVQCAAGMPVYCDDDKDCPSASPFCCGTHSQSYSKIACQAQACANSVFGQQDHMCDPKASDCDGQTTCKASPVNAAYFTCQ